MIIMTDLGPESLTPIDSFAQELGEILSFIADQHPNPDDESALSFIGTTPEGTTGVLTCSPRRYAEEVLGRTEFGMSTIQFYRDISTNLGDPTGQRVIDDMRATYSPQAPQLTE